MDFELALLDVLFAVWTKIFCKCLQIFCHNEAFSIQNTINNSVWLVNELGPSFTIEITQNLNCPIRLRIFNTKLT